MEAIIKTMEVVLKKTKITAAILSQSQKASISDLINEAVIGWCLFKDKKYIVLYSSDKNLIYKYEFYYKLTVDTENFSGEFQGKHRLKVILGYNNDFYYNFDTKEELDSVVKLLENAFDKAIEKGQFYI